MLSVQMLILAAALLSQPVNRTANRILAGFLVVATGVVTPYTIGFAGVYDAWMGLTFAPLALPLFLAPLLYGYTHALAAGTSPPRWKWHLAPGSIQLAYMTTAFLLPFETKMDFADTVDGPWVSRIVAVGVQLGLIAYSGASLRLLRRFRSGLADQRSDDDRFAARWLGRILAAMIVTALLWGGWQLWQALNGFDYFEFFGLHLAIGAIGVLLGVEGWRHATLRLTGGGRRADVVPDAVTPVAVGSRELDWPVIGGDYAARTRDAGWWRQPDLTLPGLARMLGTNSGRLSRAINLGLGMNFSTFINGLRAEGVAQALTERPAPDLLDLAFEMGFASKASFNRAFLARYGVAPSRFHRDVLRHVSDDDFRRGERKLRRAAF